MGQKVIFHVDVNSAFLSWESVHRLKDLNEMVDLREIPSAVGGDITQRHGVILAKSTPAKKYNVRTGEPIVSALKKCPELVVVAPNHRMYQEYSKAFMNILRDYSPTVEQYSIDEAFVDMTGMQTLFGEPEEAAAMIKDRIYDELGFTVNIGISTNKLLAKMASDFQKPNRVHTLFPEEIQQKMWPLPVQELFFVGGATAKKLNTLGINTIGQLAATDLELLKAHLKKHGEIVWNFANGRDVAITDKYETAAKGYGNSTTLPFDVTEAQEAKQVLLSLAESVCRRLRRDGVKIEVVSVNIRYADLSNAGHQRVLAGATDITNEVHAAACKLFDELWDGMPIRLLGISTSRIAEDDSRQMNLFEPDHHEKFEKLDQAVDSIREKFGENAIVRAAFMKDNQEK